VYMHNADLIVFLPLLSSLATFLTSKCQNIQMTIALTHSQP